MVQHGARFFGHAVWIAGAQARAGKAGQAVIRPLAPRDFGRVFIAQHIEFKGAARRDQQAAGDGVLISREQGGDFGGAAQTVLGIGEGVAAQLFDPFASTDRDHHVAQVATLRSVDHRRARGDRGEGELAGQRVQVGKAGRIAPVIERGQQERHVIAKAARQPLRP